MMLAPGGAFVTFLRWDHNNSLVLLSELVLVTVIPTAMLMCDDTSETSHFKNVRMRNEVVSKLSV
jgi:hypothetical protein